MVCRESENPQVPEKGAQSGAPANAGARRTAALRAVCHGQPQLPRRPARSMRSFGPGAIRRPVAPSVPRSDVKVKVLLLGDVALDRADVPRAHAERTVAALPGERGAGHQAAPHRTGRGGFQDPGQARQRDGGMHPREDVNMIGHASDREHAAVLPHALRSDDAMQPRFALGGDPVSAPVCRPDEVGKLFDSAAHGQASGAVAGGGLYQSTPTVPGPVQVGGHSPEGGRPSSPGICRGS